MGRPRMIRHILCCVALTHGLSVGLEGQDSGAWRASFAAGEEARRMGDAALYAREMAAAADLLPFGDPNRPVVQYHAARAAALSRRGSESVEWLRALWEEDIAPLMVSFAEEDRAFDGVRDSAVFRELMRQVAALTLSARRLGGDVFLITGAGANIVARVASDGVVLVDTGYGPTLPALRRTISQLGGDEVDVVIVTHPHEDHMGSAATLGAQAHVYAHAATATAMSEPYVFMEGVSIPPKPPAALPDTRVESPMSIQFGSEQIRLQPTEAHSAGDISVYFTDARVAHLGDAFLASNPMMYPGTVDPDAFLDRLEGFLDEMHPESVVVGGHEGVTDLPAVRRQIAVTREAMRFVRAAIENGRSVEETAEAGRDRFPPAWTAFFYQLFTQLGV